MTKKDLQELWNYYSMLDDDLDHTSRYVEPRNQENTFSLEFAKLLILACTEVESVFKLLCKSIKKDSDPGNIGEYKGIVLGRYPHFGEMEVNIPRLNKTIKPFENWCDNHCDSDDNYLDKDVDHISENDKDLPWWDAYNGVKHNRANNFSDASYRNACNAISALHLLILRLGKTEGIDVNDFQGNYIENPYSTARVLTVNTVAKEWPDID